MSEAMTEAEMKALHDAYLSTDGTGPEIAEQMWLAARAYYRPSPATSTETRERTADRHREPFQRACEAFAAINGQPVPWPALEAGLDAFLAALASPETDSIDAAEDAVERVTQAITLPIFPQIDWRRLAEKAVAALGEAKP